MFPVCPLIFLYVYIPFQAVRYVLVTDVSVDSDPHVTRPDSDIADACFMQEYVVYVVVSWNTRIGE